MSSRVIVEYLSRRRCSGATFPVWSLKRHGGSASTVLKPPSTTGRGKTSPPFRSGATRETEEPTAAESPVGTHTAYTLSTKTVNPKTRHTTRQGRQDRRAPAQFVYLKRHHSTPGSLEPPHHYRSTNTTPKRPSVAYTLSQRVPSDPTSHTQDPDRLTALNPTPTNPHPTT